MANAFNPAARMGRWSAHHRWTAVGLWFLFTVVVTVLGSAVGTSQLSPTQLANGESKQALKLLHQSGLDLHAQEAVLIQERSPGSGTPDFGPVLGQVQNALRGTGKVTGVIMPGTADAAGQISADHRSQLVRFQMAGASDKAKDHVEPVLDAVAGVQKAHPELVVQEFGEASFAKQYEDKLNKDYGSAEFLSFPVTLVILLVVFGALVAALLPLLLAATAVVTASGLLGITSHVLPVDINATSVMALIGIAVGVDYSLFYTRRFREERAEGRDRTAAVEAAAATSGRSVLVSGLAVLVALAGLYLSGDADEMATAEATMTVVVAAVFGSVTLLPAMLSLLGDRVDKGRLPRALTSRLSPVTAINTRIWSTVIGTVIKRPVATFALVGGALVAVAVPGLTLHTADPGLGDLPSRGIPVLQTYQRIQHSFPAGSTVATVVSAAPKGQQTSLDGAIADFQGRLKTFPELSGPATVRYSADRSTAALTVGLAGNGTDKKSVHALSRLRDDIIPATLAKVPGAHVAVAGTTATSVDTSHQLASRTWLVAVFVLLLTFLIMLFSFRSPAIAALTIFVNLLSVGAAYGVVVMVFQYGWGESILGFDSVGGITSWVPLFMFVILFGLSMDYHVFVVSRIRESYDQGLSTAEAVSQGILRSAGVINGAAAVMVAVAAVFGLLPQLSMKETGLGLSTAVLVDATLVRLVLLPAAMTLLGERNWSAPTWLRGAAPVPGAGADRPAVAHDEAPAYVD